MPQPQTPFQSSLLPASFRGAPFGVLDNRIAVGRRGEVHEYPFRDTPYTEDLGRRARRVQFTAFLIGDDVAAKAQRLLAALQEKGPGQLVHPLFGARSMQVDQPCEMTERWDKGRYVEFQLSFVEPGEPLYPTDGADTQADVKRAADDAGTAIGGDFNAQVAAAGGSGGGINT